MTDAKTTKGPAPSELHLRIIKIIQAAGKDGVSRQDIQTRVGAPKSTVQMHIRNARAGKKIHPGFDEKSGRAQLYLAPEHVAAFRAAHGLAPRPGVKPLEPNLPQRGTTVLAITKAEKRNTQVSTARMAVEIVLQQATEELSVEQISERAGLDRSKTRKVLQTLRQDGKVRRTGDDLKTCLWSATRSLMRMVQGDIPEPVTHHERHVNSNQRKLDPERKPLHGCALPGSTEYLVPTMRCAREDGSAHLAAKSRRGSELVGYTRPMVISSSVRGGAS